MMRSLMRKAWVLLIVFALAFTVMALPVGAEQPARPLKGQVTGFATFGPGTDPFSGAECPNHGGLATLSQGSGTVTHMGRVEMSARHCTPLDIEAVAGKMILTAANGDQLVLRYYGAANFTGPNEVTGEYEVTVVEGESTGRFADAELINASMTVVLTFESFDDPAWPANFWLKGSIDY
jgi:hypothetical protein